MPWLKLTRRVSGTVLFTAGIFLVVLPIVPGWPLIAIGLYLLSIDSPGLKRRLELLCARYPLLDRMRLKGSRLFGDKAHSDDL